MSSIGGMFTLLGNSSNMVANDAYVKAGYPSLTLFSFFPVGLVCFLFGILVLAPVTSRYLSRRKNAKLEPDSALFSMRKLAEKYQIVQNMYYLEITKDSEVADKRLIDLHLPEKFGVVVADIIRPRKRHGQSLFAAQRPRHYFPDADTLLRRGDVLQVVGSITGVITMASEIGLHMVASDTVARDDGDEYSSIGICELIIMSSSRLVKRTVAESGLRNQFGITVLGVQRGSQYIIEDIKDMAIQSGDSLLVQGTWENLARLEEFSNNWVVVGRPKDQAGTGQQRQKIPLVIAVVLAMLLVTAFNVLPIVVAVLLAALVLILGGCFKNMDDVYSTMGWETLVMMACLLPMSIAMENAGILDLISRHMVSFGGDYGPHVTLAVMYGVASLLNIVISTTPVTLLIAPVAVQVAESLQCSPLPFLVAVATAASMCFASPFSTPANALVMSAGRYTFTDYLKVGVPMQILMGVVVVAVLPYIYPFFPAS
jgi:Di- and tricarboxylate transporters